MRFQVLGPVAAYGKRGPVALGAARQRTVLAALLIEPGAAVGFDQLLDRVWGDAPPRRARETMHAYLSRLRAALGGADGPALVRRAHSYTLEVAPEAVDLGQFRALARQARRVADDGRAADLWRDALALWRGAPLAGLDSGWARAAATGLEAERRGAVLDRADVLLRCGEHAELLPELAADAAAHPWDERVAGQLMLALYRSGRQAAALAHYRTLMQRLAEELGSDPGPALRGLHQRILRQDPLLAATADPDSARMVAGAGGPTSDQPRGEATAAGDPPGETPEAPPPAQLPPAQLPADIAGFAGRAEPLRRLDALLGPAGESPRTVAITAIGGSAGVGKTALAIHWAHRVADRFPDGQVYLNLRGFDPGGGAMSTAEALRNLLELLGVPSAQIPASVEAQVGLYRTRLAGARALVVLDNARDTAQVRPLIPGSPGSMVLVTSRDQLVGLAATEGARLVRLDVLGEAEARDLLQRRLGAERVAAEPGAVDEIVAACAGLPLALAIVAARAAARLGFPLSAFADELADARGRLDALASPDTAVDVRAVFSWSYRALRPPAARMFRLLGLHPGPGAGLHAAASLAGVPAAEARRLLGELTGAHLITEHVPGRFVLHDLLRTYAAELSHTVDPEPDRHAAWQRLLDYYLCSVGAADQWLPTAREPVTIHPPRDGVTPETFADNLAARHWLTTELRALLAVIDQTAERGLDWHVQQLTQATNTFLIWRGLWHDKITAQLAALGAARHRADRPAQADVHRGLAHAYARLDRHRDARAHIDQALELYGEIGDHTGRARTLLALVWLSEREGRYRDGLRHAQQCLEEAQLGDNRVIRALARNAIGWCHTLLGEHEAAVIECQQALDELRDLGEPVNMSDVLGSLGRAHHHLGHYQQAVDYHRQAVDWCHRYGDSRAEAVKLIDLGETHHTAGDHAPARDAWQRALHILEEISHPDTDKLRKRIAELA